MEIQRQRAAFAYRIGTPTFHGQGNLEFRHDKGHRFLQKNYETYYDAATAYIDDKPVGYIQWRRSPPDAEPGEIPWDDSGMVGQIYIDPEHQGKGIGTDLYRWVKKNLDPGIRHDPAHQSELGKLWARHEERTAHAQKKKKKK
ncbi:MAG: N-acetyltransferase [Nitrosomonas sp.]|nr:MAG: N-acetyltransferase [Nitrosomonas sp.]